MESQAWVRLAVFAGVFAIMALAEMVWPARQSPLTRWVRWRANLAMVVRGAILGRIVLPVTVAGTAIWAESHAIGWLHQVNWPGWVGAVMGLLALDLAIYWQHRLFHQIPVLWRLHQVHHADPHIDSSTGLRFHPVEIALSLFIKVAVVVALGIPAAVVVLFEVALNGFAIFNHANIRLPQKLDDKLGWLIITQRLHRIHHSQAARETNSNFGFSVSWWDRLFKRFRSRAALSDEKLQIGQKAYPATVANSGLIKLLLMPFSGKGD